MGSHMIQLDDRELETVLAALQFWKRLKSEPSKSEQAKWLSRKEIEALCERLTSPEPAKPEFDLGGEGG